MSEEKIIKHTEKALKIMSNKEKTWLGKIKELTEEVIIIVFAVSITLAFHNWNDERNERKMEREFLAGVSSDLKAEARNLGGSLADLNITANYYDTVWQQIISNKVDAAYIDSNSSQLTNTLFFVFNSGRFEGFKSSGYLRLIENKKLLKHLTDLYIIAMPFQAHADEMVYDSRRTDYNTYIGVKAPMDSKKIVHVSQILNDPAVRHQIVYYGGYLHERIRQKTQLVESMKKVADEIDKELEK